MEQNDWVISNSFVVFGIECGITGIHAGGHEGLRVFARPLSGEFATRALAVRLRTR
jgi:hypothetical protein